MFVLHFNTYKLIVKSLHWGLIINCNCTRLEGIAFQKVSLPTNRWYHSSQWTISLLDSFSFNSWNSLMFRVLCMRCIMFDVIRYGTIYDKFDLFMVQYSISSCNESRSAPSIQLKGSWIVNLYDSGTRTKSHLRTKEVFYQGTVISRQWRCPLILLNSKYVENKNRCTDIKTKDRLQITECLQNQEIRKSQEV